MEKDWTQTLVFEAGIKAEGSFHVSFSHAPDFELDAGLKPVIVYARYFVDVLVYDTSYHWEHELIKGAQVP